MDPKDAATWPEVMSPDHVAAALGMHPTVVRRLIKDGEIPGRKVGGVYRTTKSALLAYLNTRDDDS